MEAGPYGSMQLLAEVGKWLQKEDIIPDAGRQEAVQGRPFIVVGRTFLLFVVMPFGPDAVVTDLRPASSTCWPCRRSRTLGILIAGWASANKYSLLGGLRAAGQLIAYELPMVLAVVGVVIQAGTLNLQEIVVKQNGGEIFGLDGIGNPYILTQFVGFLIFMIAVQAELTQTPFDMPIAESELVSGYMTEYSGIRFLVFFIAEFATAGCSRSSPATLFLGGWGVPFLAGASHIDNWMNFIGPLVMLTKMMVLTGVIFWVRFSYPRSVRTSSSASPGRSSSRSRWSTSCSPRSSRWCSDGSEAQVPGSSRARGHLRHAKETCSRTDQEPDSAAASRGAATVQYPHEKESPPTRARGVIALKEDNCTACMLCARELPRLVHLHRGHKTLAPPRRAGGKPRSVNALDRFDIDYALCMYCGICVEVCPFEALFWSPEYEYSEPRIADLLHDKSRLGEWMETVPDFEPSRPGPRSSQEGAAMSAVLLAARRRGRPERRLRHHRRHHDVRRRSGSSPPTSCTPRSTLVVVLAGAAAQYLLLAAEFVAVTQVLVYIGAIDGAVPVRHHAHPGAQARLRDLDLTTGSGSAGTVALLLLVVLATCSSTASATTSSPPTRPHRHPRRLRRIFGSLPDALRGALGLLLAAAHRRHRAGPEGLTHAAQPVPPARRRAVLHRRLRRDRPPQRRAGPDVDRAHPQLGQHQPGRLQRHDTGRVDGQVFALFVIAVAAAEVGVGLAIVLLIFRNRSVDIDQLDDEGLRPHVDPRLDHPRASWRSRSSSSWRSARSCPGRAPRSASPRWPSASCSRWGCPRAGSAGSTTRRPSHGAVGEVETAPRAVRSRPARGGRGVAEGTTEAGAEGRGRHRPSTGRPPDGADAERLPVAAAAAEEGRARSTTPPRRCPRA
jgi:NADH-quinone oxidoreductase subunit H